MLSLVLLGAIFVISFWYVGIKPMSHWKRRGIKQGKPVWVFGDNFKAFLRKESFADSCKRVYEQFPNDRYFGTYQFTAPGLVIRDPDLIKQITVKDFAHFVDHGTIIPDTNDPLFSKNLISMKGDSWKNMRPVLSPQFTSSKMKSIFLLMTDSVQVFLNHFSKRNEQIIELEIRNELTRLGVDVIASVAFGVKVNSSSEPKNEFYRMGLRASLLNDVWLFLKLFGYRVVPQLYKIFNIRLIDKEVANYFQNLVNEAISSRENKHIIRPDLIQLLVDARKGVKKYEEKGVIDTGFATVQESSIHQSNISTRYKHLTNEDITSQAMLFFIAGFETVASFLSFMTYELALNPDVQDRLRHEILETKEECGEKVTYEALMKMKYLDMVVSETGRKWPPGIQTDRVCTKPYTIQPKLPGEAPVHLEVGDTILIPTYGIHRDSKYYPDPEKFDPERFNDENKHAISPYLYMPFGVGPRNCIGSRFALLEIKTLIFYLLSDFAIVPTKKTTIPAKLDRKNFALLIEGGFHIGLKPLNV